MPRRERFILFTRYPEAGTTKTRLIPCLGPEGAADLQRQMTVHTLATALPVKASRGLEVEVRYEGGSHRRMQDWLGSGITYRRQGGGDIGRRMARALRQAFDQGSEAAVLVGSDIPDISAALLEQAFASLDDNTVALGPATDGGYYLIGLSRRGFRRAEAALFDGLAWGTSRVLAESCRRLEGLGVRFVLLAQLSDIDRPEDLSVWERYKPT